MKKSLSGLAVIVLCSFGLASESFAQMMRGGGPPQFAGVFNPKVGVGAAYEVQKQDGNKTMEMAIVGKETVDGKDAYWWEMAMPDERMGGELVFKTLLVMDGENTHASKMIMQLPGKPPMEMPAGMGRGDHSRVPDRCSKRCRRPGQRIDHCPSGNFHCRALSRKRRLRRHLGGQERGPLRSCEASRKRHHDGADQSVFRLQRQNHRHAPAVQSHGAWRWTTALVFA